MNTVECPKCTLRFEPDEILSFTRSEYFCPQCGNCFSLASCDANVESSQVWQTA